MADLKDALGEADVAYRLVTAPVEHVHANPWNPNVQNDRTYKATVESIATFGFIDPVTVREHPELEGHFQVIDGEHRWRGAQELGIPTVPLIVIDVDDVTAKRLTIVLNETRGEADSVQLGGLLAAIKAEIGDEFSTALRYDEGELKHLLDLADADWNRFAAPDDEAPPEDDSDWVTIACRVPQDFQDVWKEARERAGEERDGLHSDDKIASGQVLELLCASYLAGA